MAHPDHARFEGRVAGEGQPRWNQSWYYQAYDAATRTGVFIRLGLLETEQEANTWLIVFRDGQPLFTRTNQNLPYTPDRPDGGIDIAGMHINAEVPLQRTRIRADTADFQLDLSFEAMSPMEDCIAMTRDGDGSFAREIAQVHLEGTCRVRGRIVHRGQAQDFDGTGFRDVAAGVRNWDGLRHYRLAWPVFENGMAFSGIHGVSTSGDTAWMRMMFDGEQWRRIHHIEDRLEFDDDGFAIKAAHWLFVDDRDQRWEMSVRPLFKWLFPLDTFVLREQLGEFRLADGTIGYGLFETGYRLPWEGEPEQVKLPATPS